MRRYVVKLEDRQGNRSCGFIAHGYEMADAYIDSIKTNLDSHSLNTRYAVVLEVLGPELKNKVFRSNVGTSQRFEVSGLKEEEIKRVSLWKGAA